MANRLSAIVTKTGDEGTTGMADGSRRAKNDIRVVCLGEVDELNAAVGIALSFLEDIPEQQALFAVQHDLFDIGAELCQPGKNLIQAVHVDAIEASAAEFNENLPPLKEFILPGGSQAVAFLHLARTICRRVERSLVSLKHSEALNPVTAQYINRLSDLLFILARSVAHQDCGSEVYWRSKYSRLSED
ncbi:MAG: cob(I)yrinic acid a,c-diamide adenosyltransferase [Gammaproteobacteria bacterium]|nr:cob(I)yrinic acid a,c-diamide adenosyltransferase [Gammaproteobacteria bacterium]MCZ6796422.1 cob(I)yrinic acid a,c-diamide adenosyltransferase [Gammaproteobacteria bacterium]MCZ6882951.1 cob(I)yrinic acid a,c-diamide adenosyltransferase [Gammaproteobacteria bacterium]